MAILTLHHYSLCPASRAARLALAEWGFAFQLNEVKPWLITRDFLEINPSGELPVLMAEGRAVCGIGPIAEYLNETLARESAPHRGFLWTGTLLDRAEERRVADWFLRKFDAEVSQLLLEEKVVKPFSGAASGGPNLEAIRAARTNLKYHLSYVSFLSDQRKWLGGDSFSFADLAAAAHLSVMDYLNEVPWGEFAECKAWYARLKSRPAFRPLLSDAVPGLLPPPSYANLDF